MTSGDPRIRVDANFLFEVDPKSAVFDHVRESVTDAVADEYDDMIATDDIRSSLRTNHVTLDPSTWNVDATLTSSTTTIDLSLTVPADGDASDVVTSYIDDEVEDRFGVEPARVKYKEIRLAPGGWFVDAVYEGV